MRPSAEGCLRSQNQVGKRLVGEADRPALPARQPCPSCVSGAEPRGHRWYEPLSDGLAAFFMDMLTEHLVSWH